MFALKTKIADIFRGGQTLRPASQIKLDLKQRGFIPAFLAAGRLMRLSSEQYKSLVGMLDQISRMQVGLIKVSVPELRNLERINLETLPINRIIARCLIGNQLKLKHIVSESIAVSKEKAILEEQIRGEVLSKLSEIKEKIQTEIERIRALVNSAGLSLQGVTELINESQNTMGFKNVSIYELLEDGNLVLRFRSQFWESFWDKSKARSKYEAPGRKPITTMASVLNDPAQRIIYDVSIKDLKSFEYEGLTPDLDSIKDDLANSQGPSRYLFLRIKEDGSQWIIHIHNRVKKTETSVPAGLFGIDETYENNLEVQEKITEIKNLLEHWAIAVGLALAAARNVQRALHLEDREKPYSPEQYLRTSEIFRVGDLSIEEIKDTKDLRPKGNEVIKDLQKATIELYKEYGTDEKVLKTLFTTEIIREHTLDADDLLIVRSGEKIVGFASGKFLDIGEGDRIYYLVGTMLRKEIQARGLLLLLNFRLLLKGLVEHWSIYSNAPKSLIVAARTQDPVVLYSLYTYFKDPSPVLDGEDSEEIKKLREAIAEKLGCQADDRGIVRNIYPGRMSVRMPVEISSASLSVRAKTANMCYQLGDRDAILFIGKFSLEIPKARELFEKYGGAYKPIIEALEKEFNPPHSR